MKNKGFTLIELIGTITIISLILLIITPAITNSLKKGIKDADEQTKQGIILAAKNWASDNKQSLPKTKNGVYNVSIATMQNEGYLDNDIKLPSTAISLTSVCVSITKTNNTGSSKDVYKYEYKESGC